MRIVFEVGFEPFHLLNKYGGVLLFLVISCLTLVPLATMYVVLAITCFFLNEVTLEEQPGAIGSALSALRVCAQATLYFSVSFPFIMALLSTYMSYRMVEEHLDQLEGNDSNHSFGDVMPALKIYLERYTIVSCLGKMRVYICMIFVKLLCWFSDTSDSLDFIGELLQELSIEDTVRQGSDTAEKQLMSTKKGEEECWRIPNPGEPVAISNDDNSTCCKCRRKDKTTKEEAVVAKRRLISGECVICMRPYKCGETVVWSPNPNCRHAFHVDCMMSWMSPWQPQNRLCPCCRQYFLDDEFNELLEETSSQPSIIERTLSFSERQFHL